MIILMCNRGSGTCTLYIPTHDYNFSEFLFHSAFISCSRSFLVEKILSYLGLSSALP